MSEKSQLDTTGDSNNPKIGGTSANMAPGNQSQFQEMTSE